MFILGFMGENISRLMNDPLSPKYLNLKPRREGKLKNCMSAFVYLSPKWKPVFPPTVLVVRSHLAPSNYGRTGKCGVTHGILGDTTVLAIIHYSGHWTFLHSLFFRHITHSTLQQVKQPKVSCIQDIQVWDRRVRLYSFCLFWFGFLNGSKYNMF